MRITVIPLSSTAIELIEFNYDNAEVTFSKGGKYVYALNLTESGEYSTHEGVAQSVLNAESAGKKFNELRKAGVLTPM